MPDADLVFDAFRLDAAARQLWRGTTAVALRPKLFNALRYLIEHSGRLITREEMLRAVWSRTHVDETLLRHAGLARRAGTHRAARPAGTPRPVEGPPRRSVAHSADAA